MFSSAPVLVRPDPDLHFAVEVDAMDSGSKPSFLNASPLFKNSILVLFFSPTTNSGWEKLWRGEELFAVVLTLQDWQRRLEGVVHPFILWTDHKILSTFCSQIELSPG